MRMKVSMVSKAIATRAFLVFLSLLLLLPVVAQSQTAATFTNPFVKSRDAADPWMIYHDGFYYFTFTAGDRIEVWKSATLTGIDAGTKTTVWRAPAAGAQCCNIWAPELHFINDRWYIYYAADDGRDANHRMYVLESTGTDPQGTYIDKGKIAAPVDRWAIDGSVLRKADGSLYFIWSGWDSFVQSPQNLYIAPMSNPWTISGERVLISAPTNSWERVGWWVNEGPVGLQRGNKTFIVYSASGGSTPDYCLGMLTNTNGDVLNPSAWTKSSGCVFSKTNTVFGPGHNSFVKSSDGSEDWIIYHAKDTPVQTWAGRTARAQRLTWNQDDTPNFGSPVAPWIALAAPSSQGTPPVAPVLLKAENSSEAIALDSVTMMRDPFSVLSTHNFSNDRRTRVMLFAANVELQSGESNSALSVNAEDARRNIYQLPIEYVGRIESLNLTQIVVRLPNELDGEGSVSVSINLRGASSNKALINLKPSVLP